MTEIRSLTGIRGLAALCVLWGHVYDTQRHLGFEPGLPLALERLFLSAGRQVDLFFVLSGFILALSYGSWFRDTLRPAGYLRFLRRRLARVWPLHAAMLLAVLAMVTATAALGLATRNGLERFELATLPAHLLMVHAWGPFIDGVGEWNPPSWSVSVEFAAYLLFPILMLGLARLAARPWLAVLLAVLLGLLLDRAMHWETPGFPGVVRGVCEFSLGCSLAGVRRSGPAVWLGGTAGSYAALLLLAAVSTLIADISFVFAIAAAPLLLSLPGDNPVARFFSSRAMHFLGEISYSVYLGQFLFTAILYRLIRPEWMVRGPVEALSGLLLITAAVILLSTLSYRLIERPCRRWLAGDRPLSTSAPGPQS